jgi:predicted Fe-Mo cluster-binding NifX family protein
MNILIASEGVTLESHVARQFEKAVWYLIVNDQTMETDVVQNLTPQEHNQILVEASRRHAIAVVAGKIGRPCAHLMAALRMQAVLAPHLLAREVLEKLKAGELKTTDPSTIIQRAKELEVKRAGRRLQLAGGRKEFGASGIAEPGTARGHHHLQQYAGRGH